MLLLYIVTAYAFSTFSPQAQIVSLWPPAGIALAGCILLGLKFLPAIFWGSFIFNFGTQILSDESFTIAEGALLFVIAAGSTLQAWINYALLKYHQLELLKNTSYSTASKFILTAFACCSISAIIGNVTLSMINTEIPRGLAFWNNILIWWTGDFLGVILVTPLLLGLIVIKSSINKKWALIKGISFPLIVIIITFQLAQQYIVSRTIETTKLDFNLKAKVAENNLKKQMNNYLDALSKLEYELSSNESIRKQKFSQVASRLTGDLPGIKAMSWNPLVEQKDITDFETYAKKNIDPSFHIKGSALNKTDPMIIVQLIEPLKENKAAQGFNVFSNEARKKSMLLSNSTRAATATDIIQLVQSDRKEPGFLIFTPVYNNIKSSSSALNAEFSLKGFAVGVFLVSKIVEEALSDDLINFIDIYIYENDTPLDKVYGNQDIIKSLSTGTGLSHTFELNFANHLWTFNLNINNKSLLETQVQNSLSFLIIGALFGVLSVFIILTAFGRNDKLRHLVKDRTRELEKLNSEFAEVNSELEKVNTKLEKFAFYDSLTGLPNRRYFQDRAQHAKALADRKKSRIAILFMDLNSFKLVNDNLGHDVGDQLLLEVGIRFSAVLRNSDTLARFGGDEFIILMENNPSADNIKAVTQKLSSSLNSPITVNNESISTSTSIGIAIYPEDGTDIASLIRSADVAMYQAKKNSKNIFYFSDVDALPYTNKLD